MQIRSYFLSRALACAASTIVMGSAGAAFAQEQTQQIRIEGQSLGGAINALAKQTGAIIIVPSELVAGKTAEALSGTFTTDAALARLLNGSGLKVQRDSSGSFVVLEEVASIVRETQSDEQQRDDSLNLDVIVVTGQQELSRSPATLRNSQIGVTDSIGTLEIEKLSDVNLAQAMARIPAVSTVRGFQTSQERTVAIRGIDSRYNSMSLDGGMLWNSTRNQRSIHVDVLPASIINEITVYKTVTPEIDANSLGGHVALRTLRAFDFDGKPLLKLEGAVGGYENDGYSESASPSFNVGGAYKTTFGATGDFGLVVAAAAHRDQFFDEQNAVQGYLQTGPVDVVSGFLQGGAFDRTTEGESALVKFEARRPGETYAYIIGTYFGAKTDEHWSRGLVTIAPVNVTGVAQNTGTFSNASAQTFLGTYVLDKTTLTFTTGIDQKVGELSRVSGLISYLNYQHEELFSQGARFGVGGLSGDYRIGETGSSVRFSNAPSTISDPSTWLHQTGVNTTEIDLPMSDDVWTGRLDFDYNTQEGATGFAVKTGVFFRQLVRDFDQTEVAYRLPTGTNFTLASVVPANTVLSPAALTPITINPASYWQFLRTNGVQSVNPALTSDYNLVEDVYAAHGALYWTDERWSVLAGLRYERTEYESDTNLLVSGVPEPLAFGRAYDFALPNVQAQYDLTSAWRIKAAYTETIARPDFNTFAVGRSENVNLRGDRIVSTSNPDLKARESKNVDIALEYYGDLGFATLTYFTKDIANEIFQQNIETRDASGLVVTREASPQNVGSATLKGLEFGFAIDSFERLSPTLKPFSLLGNFVLLEGELQAKLADGTPRTLEGLVNTPEWLSNLTLSYDQGPWSASLGTSGRGRTTTGGIVANPAGDGFAETYYRLDSKVGFQVSDAAQVFVEARNLTDSWFIEENRRGSLGVAVNPGRSVFVGVRFRQ